MFSNLKVRSCIIGVLALLLIAIAATCGLAIWNAQRAHEKLEGINDVYTNQVTELDLATIQALRAASVLNTLFIQWQGGETSDLSGGVSAATRGLQASRKHFQTYTESLRGRVNSGLTENVAKSYTAYTAVIERMAGAVNSRAVADFSRSSTQAGAARDAYSAAADAFKDEIDRYSDNLVAQAQSEFEGARNIMLAVLVAAILLAIGCWVLIRRMVLQPLRLAGTHFDRIAQGDFTGRVNVQSKNEIGALFEAIKRMQESLTTTIHRVRSGVQEINLGTREIASGNTDLSSRTEQQAASLEETAATMEELASTVKQNADNARQANKLAASASDVAERGGDAVSDVVQTMEAISTSSKKISEIVGVIDSIAFQTNILALNAAVEAARAGEQGKGFAVVAAEVRTLAQRSAQAAKEIKGLIEDSSSKVSVGSHQVEQAGATMKEIVASVKRVTDIIGEIAAASAEQSNGIDQVNQAVTQMDDVTQQNAALVEQAAAASGALQTQAEALAEAVAVFKIDHTQAGGPARASTAAQPSSGSAYAQPSAASRRAYSASHETRASSQQTPERASMVETPVVALPAPTAAARDSRAAKPAGASSASTSGAAGQGSSKSASSAGSGASAVQAGASAAVPRLSTSKGQSGTTATTDGASRPARTMSTSQGQPTSRAPRSASELRREIRPTSTSGPSQKEASPSAPAASAPPAARRRTSTTPGAAPSAIVPASKSTQPVNDDDWESF
ncbi:methyl-accepting chemotaxis protein [Schauerella aestuarii]|uniref:methyl-accepting chemotaxis protein n=1 Tax=Schauerella aestuarii TaxID=2511204 RepID=UPI002E2D2D33|nr:methyl-accepting chemotaxis protein [Achromobacter aestuarii]